MISAEADSSTARGGRLAWLLVVLGIAVYINSLPNPFVFDDIPAIVENYHLRQLWPLSESLTAPPQVTVAGRPLVSFSLALNHAVAGMDVRGYHALNIAVHLLCALTLFGIVRRTLLLPPVPRYLAERASGLALAAASLWLVHPLNSEVVNYVVQRTESIMALCYLLTLYCAIRADESGARGAVWNGAALLACALGMLSKESMVTAPLTVLLYDTAFAGGTFRRRLSRRRGLYLGLAACWLLLAAILWTGPRSETVGFAVGIGSLDYLANQGVIIVDYLKTALWPHPLVFDYGDARPIPWASALPYVLLVAALAVAAIVAFVRRPAAGFAALWFFVTLAPTSSWVPIASEVGAERRMYLPLAGLSVLGVVAVAWLLERGGRERRQASRIGLAALLVVGCLFSIVSMRRNLDYRSHERIWRSAVEARPLNPRAHVNLGHALQTSGRDAEAVRCYERALELDPGYAQAHFNLGVLLAEQGDRDAALARYRRALQLNPNLAEVHHNLAAELGNRGELATAIVHFREAIRLSPESVSALFQLGRALRLTGRPDQALPHLREAVRLDPDHVEALSELSWLLATAEDSALRDGSRALELAERAVKLDARLQALTLDTLAAALAENGRFEEAEATAREALGRAERPVLAQEIEARLTGYRSGRPHRE